MSSSTDFDAIPLREAVLCAGTRVLGGIIEGDRAVLLVSTEVERDDPGTQVLIAA